MNESERLHSPSHGENTGSIPVGSAKLKTKPYFP
jgi:hypothetical protein